MARYHANEDWEDTDPDAPDESDTDADEGDEFAETIDCPHCGREVYESAEQCPKCGRYLSHEDAPPGRKPWWILIAAALALAAALTWILG
jgi:hypothetical protein